MDGILDVMIWDYIVSYDCIWFRVYLWGPIGVMNGYNYGILTSISWDITPRTTVI
jgi:hypothetical protein